MAIHPMKMVCWISIVVIHIFIILIPKDAKLIMIVQLISGTAVWVISVRVDVKTGGSRVGGPELCV